MRAAWRWLTKPVISIADGLACAAFTIAADAMKLGWHLPWAAVLTIAMGATAVALFGIGFIKGLIRSVRN